MAEVQIGFPPPIGDAVINDGPGLLLIVEKQPTGNTLDVTRNVEKALDDARPGPEGRRHRPDHLPPRDVHRAVARQPRPRRCSSAASWSSSSSSSFLFDWRTALISLTAIPLSLIAATLVLRPMGATINTMVLAGLVIAMGEVVDDAIIDVENIVRRLRLNRAAGTPESAFRVVLAASLEVRSAVVYASLIVILVFLPVFFLEGLAGSFFRPLALAYVLAILASLLVALTVTPALSLMLLTGRGRTGTASRRWSGGSRRSTGRSCRRSSRRPGWAVVVLVVAFAATGWAVVGLGEEFLPNFQENDFLMHCVEKPGTSLEAMTPDHRATPARSCAAIPGVRNFGSHIGRAEVADEVVGPNFTELWISVDPKADHDETVAKIQDGHRRLSRACIRDVLTYLKERIKEVLTGAGATIVVRIFGPDIDVLRAKAQEVDDGDARRSRA